MQTEFSKTPPFLSKNTQGFKKKPRPFNKSPFFQKHRFSKTPVLFKIHPFYQKTPGFQNLTLSKPRPFKNTDHSKKPWPFTKKSCFQKPRPFPKTRVSTPKLIVFSLI